MKKRLLSPRTDTNLAEMASCQLEYKYLAHLTEEPDYFFKSDKVMEIMEREQGKTFKINISTILGSSTATQIVPEERSGLWLTHWFVSDGRMYGCESS